MNSLNVGESMDRYGATKRVAILGIVSNILLLILKLIIGLISRSQAMIADGFNSAGDVFASIMTFLGNKISSQPEDDDHPYGHGKAEYIFSMIISFSLLLVTVQVFINSLKSIVEKKAFTYSAWLIGVALVTIILKALLWIYTSRAGKKWDNLLIVANSEDHRNDILVTLSTLLGIILGKRGIFWVDGLVGIGISLWIGYTGISIFIKSYHVLMDTNIEENYIEAIWEEIEAIKGVDHVDSINAMPIGVSFILIIKVSVLGSLSVEEGHDIATDIKRRLKTRRNVGDVVVHVNPC